MRRNLPWIAVLFVPMLACLPEEQASYDPSTSSSSDSSGGESTGSEVPTQATGFDLNTSSPGDAETSTSENPDETTTTASETPACGDGVIDPGEGCDLGDAFNVESGACLPNCMPASCGDGFVQAGVEQCDFGIGNNYDYGGCLPETCFWGPACGDGEVTPGHEICDPGAPEDPMGGELSPCGQDCRYEGRIVFLSSETYNGKALGGLDGAHLKCQTLAKAFDPDRYFTYRAWLSDDASDPDSTFVHSAVPYVQLNGVEIAGSYDELIQDGPQPGITITDTLHAIADVLVWTHTTQAGTKIPNDHHCEQWTSASFKSVAMVGWNALPVDSPDQDTWTAEHWWTYYLEGTCNMPYHLYCFEN